MKKDLLKIFLNEIWKKNNFKFGNWKIKWSQATQCGIDNPIRSKQGSSLWKTGPYGQYWFKCRVLINVWVLYISTSVWVLRTPNAGWNDHFQRFYLFFLEKSKKLAANFIKKQFFLSLHQSAGWLFYSQKMSFFL